MTTIPAPSLHDPRGIRPSCELPYRRPTKVLLIECPVVTGCGADFIEELLYRAGFRRVERCSYGQTASEHGEIVELDDRESESIFVEAVK